MSSPRLELCSGSRYLAGVRGEAHRAPRSEPPNRGRRRHPARQSHRRAPELPSLSGAVSVVINGRVIDISKRQVSRNLVERRAASSVIACPALSATTASTKRRPVPLDMARRGSARVTRNSASILSTTTSLAIIGAAAIPPGSHAAGPAVPESARCPATRRSLRRTPLQRRAASARTSRVMIETRALQSWCRTTTRDSDKPWASAETMNGASRCSRMVAGRIAPCRPTRSESVVMVGRAR